MRYEFGIGDRVVFVNNPLGYNVGESNPLFGTKFFCVGTVSDVSGNGETTYVEWDNGNSNDYVVGCLQLYSKFSKKLKNPNFLFQRRKKK